MIAIGLLIVVGIYLSLFVLVGVKAKTWRTRTSWWLVLLLPIILKTWDMPVGYYKYKSVCATEGGAKIFLEHQPAAKIVRLDADSEFGIAYARELLADYPSLEAVEAADEHFSDARPRAYSRYERNPESPVEKAFPRDNFKPVIRLLDKVENSPSGRITTSRGRSEADYIISKTEENIPIRLALTHYWLKKSDGAPVAKTTTVIFSWTDEKNTLLGRTAAEYCGKSWDSQKFLFDLAMR